MIIRKYLYALVMCVCGILPCLGQDDAPIRWQVSVKMTSVTQGVAVFKARIAPGWHLYGFNLPAGGPKSTEIDMSQSTGIRFTAALKPDRTPVKVHDSMFDLDLSWWDSDIAFRRPFVVTDAAKAALKGKISYMGCNDETCSPPKTQSFDKKIGK